MKKIIILTLLIGISLNSFSQEKTLYNDGSDKGVKAKPAKLHGTTTETVIENITGTSAQTSQEKYTHIYLIVYKDENGNHLHEPKKAYRSEGETKDDVKKRIAEQEKGRMYELNTSNYIYKDRPYGLLYSTTKDGIKKYKLGVYTTEEYAQKMWKEKENYGATCIEIISLN